MKTRILFSVAIAAISVSTLFVACSKSNSADAPAGTQNVSLLLTDGSNPNITRVTSGASRYVVLNNSSLHFANVTTIQNALTITLAITITPSIIGSNPTCILSAGSYSIWLYADGTIGSSRITAYQFEVYGSN